MLKLARILSISFHPLFITFFNFLFFILLTDKHGAALGFVITLFFLAGVMIPVFYTFAIVYNEKKQFDWSQLSDMSMLSRKKLLAYTVIYNVVFLLFILNLNDAFLGIHKPMFASVLMGLVFSMMMAFVFHLLNIKNSLHALTAALFLTFCVIFSWEIPGQESLINNNSHLYLIFGGINLMVLGFVVWARKILKAHSVKEILFGILIGIISPVLLTLLAHGI